MEKAHAVAGKIAKKIEAQGSKRKPRLMWTVKKASYKEGFNFQYAGGEFRLDAASAASAVFGLHQLQMGVVSGHAAELEGEWRPRFPLRPLWIGCDQEIALSTGVSTFCSSYLCEAAVCQDRVKLERFCEHILELGYNCILLGSGKSVSKPGPCHSSVIIKFVCSILHEYGLKIIVKPELTYPNAAKCVLDQAYYVHVQHSLKQLGRELPQLDGIFWESHCWLPECREYPLVRETTEADLVRAEIKMLEGVVKKPLIYYIPASNQEIAKQQAVWIPSVCDDAGTHTILAFPAVAGDMYADHLPPHPLWAVLRRSPDVSSTALMPIVNIGSVGQGEGLWPSLNLDLSERYIGGCLRHRFAGAMCLVNRLSEKGTFLHCNLWLAAQLMWREQPVLRLAETWFLAERPDLNFPCLMDALYSLRVLTLQLSHLRSLEQDKHQLTQDECRVLVESILAKLKHLQIQFEKTRNKKSSRPTAADYFIPFARDARLITLRALQNMHMPLLHLKKEEDSQGGFWVEGLSGEMGKFLDNPQKRSSDSVMEVIYNEFFLNHG